MPGCVWIIDNQYTVRREEDKYISKELTHVSGTLKYLTYIITLMSKIPRKLHLQMITEYGDIKQLVKICISSNGQAKIKNQACMKENISLSS